MDSYKNETKYENVDPHENEDIIQERMSIYIYIYSLVSFNYELYLSASAGFKG